MTRPADSALDELVGRLAVEDVIVLSDDELDQDSPSQVEENNTEAGAGEDSDACDYGDEDDFDYVFDDLVDCASPAEPSRDVVEDEDDPLASFRRSWQAEVEEAHQPPLAPPSLLKIFETSSLLHRILSEPLLSRFDLGSASLVTSAFRTPAQFILFHQVDLDTPLRSLRLLEVLETSPHLAQHIDTLSISLGDLDAVLREVPFVRARMKARRQEQNSQPNEWFWEGGAEMERRRGGREGKQAWEEDLWLKLGKRASGEEFEQSRNSGLFEEVTKAGSLSAEEQEELRAHLQRTFSSWPLDGLVQPFHQDDSNPSAISDTIPPSHPIPIPTLSPTFAHSLFALLSSVPNLSFAHPATYSTSSAILPALHLSSTANSLVINPHREDNPVARRLGVALEKRSCRLALRPNGLGPPGAPASIASLDVRDCIFVGVADGVQPSVDEASRWSLRELKLERVGWELECERGAAADSSLVPAVGPQLQRGQQDTPFPSADLLRFVGASPNTLASLSLDQVDGFAWSSINATILANSSTLTTLHLNLVNGGSTVIAQEHPFPRSRRILAQQTHHPSSDGVTAEEEPEEEEEPLTFTKEQVRDFLPFGPFYNAEHHVLSAEKIAQRTKTPAGREAYERDQEHRLLSFKLWERWIGPNAIPVERVRKEQQQQSLAFHRALASIKAVKSVSSATLGSSLSDPSPADNPSNPSLLFALSRCSALKHLHLVDHHGSSSTSVFKPDLVDALLHARPPLEELHWSVAMEHRTRKEWMEWEEKVREVLRGGSDERMQVYVVVSLQRDGIDFNRGDGGEGGSATRAVQATRFE
ncbi:hypothetical protein BCR35DRAFT_299616 [Leucosporidium creatinivorum]|uniref:Uncharacterized protein n=1 Tax=Leucosporidium creatinivorum TaxID=106004 RepID=A0A1Y2G0B2_9BASI|nr:hypothetical protein BCR35DRAFT_299616 [Leucosporidium creatinivorum]